MSFELMNEEELRLVAAAFAVDLDECVNSKGNLNPILAAAAIAEEGVTIDMWEKMVAAKEAAERKAAELEAAKLAQEALDEAEDLEPIEDVIDTTIVKPRKGKSTTANDVLVKMERQNPYYEVAGKTFTLEHPFVVMTPDEAQRVFDFAPDGFRIATPREAQEYYG